MKIKITMKSNREILVSTSAVTMEGFMESLVMSSSDTFAQKTGYVSKYGDYLEIDGVYIRYSEIVSLEESFS